MDTGNSKKMRSECGLESLWSVVRKMLSKHTLSHFHTGVNMSEFMIYPDPISCYWCNRIIYGEDKVYRDGFGGYLCAKCYKELKEREEEDDERSLQRFSDS